MNLKDEAIASIPTQQAKVTIALLLLCIPILYAGLWSLNEAWLQLDSQSLEKVRWLVIAIVILCSSLYLNLHFIFSINRLSANNRFLIESREKLIKDTFHSGYQSALEDQRESSNSHLTSKGIGR